MTVLRNQNKEREEPESWILKSFNLCEPPVFFGSFGTFGTFGRCSAYAIGTDDRLWNRVIFNNVVYENYSEPDPESTIPIIFVTFFTTFMPTMVRFIFLRPHSKTPFKAPL